MIAVFAPRLAVEGPAMLRDAIRDAADVCPNRDAVTAAMAALASGPWCGAAGWFETWRSHGLAFREGPGGDTTCEEAP